MLHHEESPEKSQYGNPPFLDKPPPFSSKNFQTPPPFPSILKKSNPPPRRFSGVFREYRDGALG